MRYSNKGKKNDFDENGIIKEESKKYFLTHLLSKCKDFMNEKTDLQHLCDNLGNSISSNYSVLFTPKFHLKWQVRVLNTHEVLQKYSIVVSGRILE